MKKIYILILLVLFSCVNRVKYIDKYKNIDVDLRYIVNNKIIIDDFNDKDFVDKSHGIWKIQNDAGNNGNSTCSFKLVKGISNKGYALHFDYILGDRFKYRYAILDDDFKIPLNCKKYKSISFYLRGSGNKIRIKLWSANIEGWDWHGYTIAHTPEKWTKYSIPFLVFKQEGWGKRQKLDLSVLKKIDFQTASMKNGEKGWFEIDDITIETNIDKKYIFKEVPIVRTDKRRTGCFLGVFGPGYETTPKLINSLEKKIGKKFAQIMWYEDWTKEFPMKKCKTVWNAGYMPHITWEAWDMMSHKNIVTFDDILNGKWDAYIKKYAEGVKEFGHPVIIRWGHEMNGDWYPWSIPQNNFDYEKYKKVFRYLHNKYEEVGATNAQWAWCPNNLSFPKDKRNNFVLTYPGDKYVDWIALDGYNFGVAPGFSDKWLSFTDVFGVLYSTVVANFPSKPIMIGEYATGDNGGNKAEWILDAYKQIKEKFKAIKLAIWFNIDKEVDWRIDGYPEIADAYRKAVADDYFLTSRDTLAGIKEYSRQEQLEYISLLKKINPFWEKKVLKVKKASDNIAMDGNLKEFKNSFKIILKQKQEYLVDNAKYNSKDDFAAMIGLKWDTKNLYVGAKITDDVSFKNDYKDGDIWRGDCIELVLSINPNADIKRIGFTEGDFQLLITPGNNNGIAPHIWNATLKKRVNGVVKVNTWEKGYLIEFSIPFMELGNYIPKIGDKIGFNIAIDDADSSNQREGQAIWFGNSSFYYNPSVWNLIEFVK